MDNDRLISRDNVAANLIRSGVMLDGLKTLGIFSAECLDKYGRVKWKDIAPNVVTTQGKNDMMDKYLDRGAAYAATVMGLHTTVGNAASTYNAPTPQVEATVIAARLAAPMGAANASSVKALSPTPLAFSITGGATISGCFIAIGIAGITVVGHTTVGSILFSTGAFTGGNRAVVNGDTLNVTYTLTMT